MIKSTIIAAAVAIGTSIGGIGYDDCEKVLVGTPIVDVEVDERINLEIYFESADEYGSYWIEPSSESEKRIFVGYDALWYWGVNLDEIQPGDSVTGLFDSTGWELLGIH